MTLGKFFKVMFEMYKNWSRFTSLALLFGWVVAEVSGEDLVEQWLETERLIVEEKAAWERTQKSSQQLLTLYKEELALLDEELLKAGQSAPETDAEVEKQKAIIEATEKARLIAMQQLTLFQPKALTLFDKLPKPLQQQLEADQLLLQDSISNQNIDDVLRAAVRVLSEAAKFDRAFLFEEHEISLAGEKFRAKVMYLGLSRAFFIAGKRAGFGEPTDKGWVFTERPELKSSIEKAFAVKSKELPSALFELPLKVR